MDPSDPEASDVDSNITSVARRIRMGVAVDITEIDSIVERLTTLLSNKQQQPVRVEQPRHRSRRASKSAKVRRYAKCQKLLFDNPRELARIVEENDMEKLKQDDTWRSPFSEEEVINTYGPLWGTEGNCDWQVPSALSPSPPEDVWTPINPEEVMLKIKRIPRSSAGGPDNIRRSDLGRVPGIHKLLARLFMVLLVMGYYPRSWTRNRTVLIPKAGKDPSLIGHNRPITIGSILARLYSGVICARLMSGISFSQRQKGFMSVNGTFENSFLLDEAIKSANRYRKDLVAVVVDIKRAFDTVPHRAISAALGSAGMPPDVVSRVMSMYECVETTFKSKDGDVNVQLKRGVKQGDPSSPCLFNTVLDPLISGLAEQAGEGYGPLAYADDLVVLCKSVVEARLALAKIVDFLSAIGMELSVDKCLSFWLKRTSSGSMALTDPELSVGDSPVRVVTAKDGFQYLGVKFSPTTGLCNGSTLQRLGLARERISGLPLKPRQKIRLFYEFVIPRCFYRMAIDPPSKTRLKSFDAETRVWVKSVLHLPPSTPRGLLHAQTRKGGLGLPVVASQIWLSHLKAADAVISSGDPLIVFFCRLNGVLERVRTSASRWNIEWPDRGPDLALAKSSLRQEIVDEWMGLGATGHGVESFRDDQIGNRWLRDHSLLPESQFLIAVRLRGNLFGVRSALRRVDPGVPAECRQCGHESETLAHVLNGCQHNHAKIVSRHDEIRDFLSARLQSLGWTVTEETLFEIPTGRGRSKIRLKPDLVAIKDGVIHVLDVAVTYEDGDSLRRVAVGKIEKYSVLERLLVRRFQGQSFSVLPMVIGSRGALPKDTKSNLASVGIAASTDGLTMSLMALRSSIAMACRHMDR